MKTPKASQPPLERAIALHRSGHLNEAEAFYRKAIFRNPKNHEAVFALSALLFDTGRFEEWTRYLERAVELCPTHPKYRSNLGEAYRRQGKLELAKAAFDEVLAEHPDFAEVRQNLAMTLISAGAFAEALPELERTIALRPDNPIPYVSLAWALLHLHRPEESAASARRAIELAPNLPSAHRHLGDALDAQGERSSAITSYRRAVELDPADHTAHSHLIMTMLTDPSYDATAVFTEARAWAKLHAEPLRKHVRPHTNDKDPERRLRIGYVSRDFRAHPLQQFLVPTFEQHDNSTFDVFLYSSVDRPDAETAWYRDFAGDRFREVQLMDDVQAAELVRRDRIDVLVDLAVHTSSGRLRLFACKPAPLQMTWLGCPETTGLTSIDYRITDPLLDPPGSDLGVYSEQCLYLPETYWCYASLNSELRVGPLSALAAGYVTFGCQNSHRKLHPRLLALWARVLNELPQARLFLLADEHVQAGLRLAFARLGIVPDRIEFGLRASRYEYLERYHRIDIGLDTFPYNGHTTTLDAAWMGVPVVTLTGSTAVHRAGSCIAMNLGLPELVATSEDEYVEKAVALAQNLDHLSRLRAELRRRLETSPLGDAPRFVRHLENAYRSAWRRYCAEG